MRAVNLIPSEQRGGGAIGARSEGAAFAVLGLLAGVAVLTLMYGLAHHSLSSRRSEASSLTARAAQVQAQAAQLAPYTSFVAIREQRLQAISTLIGSRFDWPAAMGELSRVLPSDVSLSSLQGTIGTTTGGTLSSLNAKGSSSSSTTTASVSSATPPGAVPTFTLAGCAASQVVVAQTLVRLRLISGVSNVTLQSSTKTGSSGSGGSTGACPGGDPVFSMQIAFQPLPTPPASNLGALESATPSSSNSQAGGARALSSSTVRANR
jgi:Tfp pilus assembly protein PilN